MNKITLVLAVGLLSSCTSPPPPVQSNDDDIEMSSIAAEHVTQPRSDIDATRTFYRMTRGTLEFDVSASDLATALEKPRDGDRVIGDDVRLAAKLRAAIAASTAVLLETDVPAELRRRANFALMEIFQAGGYRVVQGGEEGSSIVVAEYSFRRGTPAMPFMGAGVVFFWSKSRHRIFSVTYWIT